MKAYDLRARRGEITQEELRKEMGWQSNTISDIENGNVGIDQDTYDSALGAIAKLKAERSDRREAVPA